MSKKDFYSILGVGQSANQAEIKKAYRQKAMQYHPDRNPGDAVAEAKFKEVAEAYATLSDDQKKAQYDQMGHEGYSQYSSSGGRGGYGGGAGMEDLFSGFQDIFSMFGGGRKAKKKSGKAAAARGSDLSLEISISLKDAFLGVRKDILIYRDITCASCNGMGGDGELKYSECAYCKGHGQITVEQGFFAMTQPCPKCAGLGSKITNPCKSCKGACKKHGSESISVTIPNNVFDGADLRLVGKGDAGVFGGPSGDLYLKVRISKDSNFTREGDDIVTKVLLDYPLLVLGALIDVTNIDGSIEKIQIPAGSFVGKRVTIQGKGFNQASRRGKGDMIVELHCRIPTKVSANAEKLLKEYAEEIGCTKDIKTQEKSRFSSWFS